MGGVGAERVKGWGRLIEHGCTTPFAQHGMAHRRPEANNTLTSALHVASSSSSCATRARRAASVAAMFCSFLLRRAARLLEAHARSPLKVANDRQDSLVVWRELAIETEPLSRRKALLRCCARLNVSERTQCALPAAQTR